MDERKNEGPCWMWAHAAQKTDRILLLGMVFQVRTNRLISIGTTTNLEFGVHSTLGSNRYVRVVLSIVVIILNGIFFFDVWFQNPMIGSFWRRRRHCNNRLQSSRMDLAIEACLGCCEICSSCFFGVCSLQFAALVLGRKNGLAGFFIDYDSLRADESFLEEETGSETR